MILKSHFTGGEVIVPANICYAAVYPIVFAGNIPVFCDVDSADGNVRLKNIQAKVSSQTKAVIVPHMYGNPVAEIAGILAFCKQCGIMLIEDCASAMGAELSGRPTGTFGDYVVYSTGYAKTIDLGFGGIVASDDALSEMARMEHNLDEQSPSWQAAVGEFSKHYRAFRNAGTKLSGTKYEPYFRQNDFRNLFLFRSRPGWQDEIAAAVTGRLSEEIQSRRKQVAVYHRAIAWEQIKGLREYKYAPGAVPWRYSLLLAPKQRRQLIDALLREHIPVSDWYPTIAELFADNEVFPQAEYMGTRIINFPLALPEEKIWTIGQTISQIMETA